MAKINRFTKIAPAKFNPLSAEEIMKVPLMKGAMEQEQIQAIEDKRLSVLNADVAPGDVEQVRAEQARINEGLDNVINNIQSNGVGFKSTDALNKLMSDINRSTSKAGLIGGASDFNVKRTAARTEARDLAIKKGYNMDTYSQYERAFDQQQSAFNPAGKLTGGDYNALYLPNQLTPEEMLEAEVTKLGTLSGPSSSGAQVTTNKANLAAAKRLILSRYDTDESYKRLLELSGMTREELVSKLDDKADVMLSSTVVNPKVTKASTAAAGKAAAKAKEKQDAIDFEEAEPLISRRTSAINPTGIDITAAGMTVNEELKITDPAQYIKTKNLESIVRSRYDRDAGVADLKIIDETKRALAGETSIDSVSYATPEEAERELQAKYTTTTEGSFVGNPELGLQSDTGDTGEFQVIPKVDDEGKETYHIVSTTNKVKKYNTAVERYNQGLDAFKAADMNHVDAQLTSVNNSVITGSASNKNEVARWHSSMNDAISTTNGFNVVSAVKTDTDKEGEISEPEHVGLTIEADKKNFSKNEQDIKHILKDPSSYTIVNKEQSWPNDYYGPRIVTTIAVKNADGTDSTYDLILEGNQEGLREKTPFMNSFTTSMDITDDTRAYREQFNRWNKYKGIQAEESNQSEYLQSDVIASTIREGKVGNSVLQGATDIGLLHNNGTYTMTTRDKDGVPSIVSIGDVMSGSGLIKDKEYTISEFANLGAHLNPQVYDMVLAAFERAEPGESGADVISKLLEDTNPYTNSDKGLFLNTFK